MNNKRNPQARATLGSFFLDACKEAGTDIGSFKKNLESSENEENNKASQVKKASRENVKLKKRKNKKNVSSGKKKKFIVSSRGNKPVLAKKKKEKKKSNKCQHSQYTIPPRKRSSPDSFSKQMECYKTSPKVLNEGNKNENNTEITITEPLEPNKTYFRKRPYPERNIPDNLGNEVDLPGEKNNDCDIVIGLDFGTSSVKVVLHDPPRKQFYAVPFFPVAGKIPFIFPSKVYLTYISHKNITIYQITIDHNL